MYLSVSSLKLHYICHSTCPNTAAKKCDDATILALLDDIFVVGQTDQMLGDLKTFLGRNGLVCNQKCELYCPNDTDTNSLPVPVSGDGIKVLGIPIGNEQFICSKCRDMAVSGCKLTSHLPGIGGAQSAIILL